jgi:hypothetical protein
MTRFAFALAAALLMSSCMMFRRPPGDSKYYEPNQTSAAQMYHASFAPAESIKVGRLHAWTIRVTDGEGSTRRSSPSVEACRSTATVSRPSRS